ncbi:Na+:solute symporter [candidate division KSB1 bacterium]|nr:Na+:solute symporter [candidate division KSB1 bacterium]
MELHFIDICIIIAYFAVTLSIGVWFRRLAAKNLDAYFLGGKNMPFYILSISNASGMFDVSGTMWLVSLLFVYGLKSLWMPWMWPVFNQVFMMVYLSVWLRRSNVMTGAEWMSTRFGSGRGARLSHLIVVIFALVSVIGFMAYGFIGIGKFCAVILPFNLSPNTYALILYIITGLYVVQGGLFSVVATDVMQFAIMTVASFIIAVIAINQVSPEALAAVTPEGWGNVFFTWKLDLDWTGMMDSAATRIGKDGYSIFGAFFMMMLFKGFLVSAAGPIPSHDMQRILANRSPRDAAKMSGLNSVILMFPRYLMIAGLTVLVLVFFSNRLVEMGDNIDFELVLPLAISRFVPVGLTGLLIAGLLAAFMSTTSSMVNVAPSYVVNDIYKRYINPRADDKKLVFVSYLASAVVVIVGIGFGYIIESVDEITRWIVSALWAGYAAPNMLKWYWWRFNGYGFFAGMLSGLVSALIFPFIFSDLIPIYRFPFIFAISLGVSILSSYLTAPESKDLLKKFYSRVRPWGFWKPVLQMVRAENPDFAENRAFKRDMLNVVIGIVWQFLLMAMPVYIVIQEKTPVMVTAGIFIVCSVILKKSWYDKLED